jgi:hypothetical protein
MATDAVLQNLGNVALGDFTLGVTFSKVDAEARTVEGPVCSEAIDKQGEVVDFEATKEALAAWPGNIREMHQPKAVGKGVGVTIDEAHKRATLKTYVSLGAEDTWQKILDGTLTGYSIGGKRLAQRPDMVKDADGKQRRVTRVTKFQLNEVSLVDNPANPDCRISIVKMADDGLLHQTDVVEDAPAAYVLGNGSSMLTVRADDPTAADFRKMLREQGFNEIATLTADSGNDLTKAVETQVQCPYCHRTAWDAAWRKSAVGLVTGADLACRKCGHRYTVGMGTDLAKGVTATATSASAAVAGSKSGEVGEKKKGGKKGEKPETHANAGKCKACGKDSDDRDDKGHCAACAAKAEKFAAPLGADDIAKLTDGSTAANGREILWRKQAAPPLEGTNMPKYSLIPEDALEIVKLADGSELLTVRDGTEAVSFSHEGDVPTLAKAIESGDLTKAAPSLAAPVDPITLLTEQVANLTKMVEGQGSAPAKRPSPVPVDRTPRMGSADGDATPLEKLHGGVVNADNLSKIATSDGDPEADAFLKAVASRAGLSTIDETSAEMQLQTWAKAGQNTDLCTRYSLLHTKAMAARAMQTG